MRVSMSIMGIILLCAIGAVGVIIASDQRIQSGDDESREKIAARVIDKRTAIDDTAKADYHQQLIRDVQTFGMQFPYGHMSNSVFSSQLYRKLNAKFYWRDWFVLVAAPTNSRDLAIHACEFNQHNYHGRTIAVASVDKTKHHVSGSSLLNHLKLYIQSAARPGSHSQYRYTCADSNAAFGQLPASAKSQCSSYAAAGVVCMKNTDIHIQAASSRYSSYNPHRANLAFTFG